MVVLARHRFRFEVNIFLLDEPRNIYELMHGASEGPQKAPSSVEAPTSEPNRTFVSLTIYASISASKQFLVP